jgi:hypothetical protein
VRYPGKDLSRVALVVGSGGVLRHSPRAAARALVEAAVSDPAGGWRTPERATSLVDVHYVLAAAGLIGRTNAAAAVQLLRRSLLDGPGSTGRRGCDQG